MVADHNERPHAMKLSELAQTVEIRSKPGTRVPFQKQQRWQQEANGWTCTLAYRGRRLTIDFWQGTGIRGEPDAAGVLSCLLSDASGAQKSFENFCDNFGYDRGEPDSRKEAMKIYRACVAMATKLEKLLGSDYASFMSAENDV